MNLLLLLMMLFATYHVCENANILVIFPLVGKSHFNMLGKLLKELTLRGHEVDVVSHFPLERPPPRYNDLSIKGTLPALMDNMSVTDRGSSNMFIRLFHLLYDTGPTICKPILNSETAKALKNSTKKYDLLITHYLATNCMLGFAHLFQIPIIGVITSVNLPWVSSLIGLPDHPSYIPNYFTPYIPKMTIWQRFTNTIINIISNISFRIYNNEVNIITRNFFGTSLSNIDDMARNMSLVFVNSHYSIHQSRPVPPNFVEVAGLHIDDNVTLSSYFQEALRTDTKGIILLSFGSNLRSDSFPEDKLQAFFQTFKNLPYKIIWKGNRERFPKHIEIPHNIQFESWIPQLGILCHPNVKLFISHGGMLGTLEAHHCGVPVLGIPIFADQYLNIQNSVSKGMAIEVPYKELSENTLLCAITQLLNNSKYKENAENVSKLFKDRPQSALETAIYWIEYVIRYNGAPHLRTIGADLPWYQYYLVDVIGIFVIIFASLIYSLCKSFSFLYLNFTVTKQTHSIKNKKD